ncbi:MAG: outer membrane protein assembly factor, partial [Pedobacter sp.]
MRFFLLRTCALLVFVTILIIPQGNANAQNDTIPTTSVDPKIVEWETATIPREYVIGGVSIEGIRFLDTSIVLSISGLQTNDKFTHPGTDIFSKAISNLWRQKLFSDVEIYVTKIVDDKVWIEINVTERPRLAGWKWHGIKKADQDELQGKIQLLKQTIITENMRRNIREVTKKFFADKGYSDVGVRIDERPDAVFKNSNYIDIYVDKGKKVKIDGVSFVGNENVDGLKLKKQMKDTKEKMRISLFPARHDNIYGATEQYRLKDWANEYGFLSFTKTRRLLDPYLRVKFSSGKFNPVKYE